MGQVEQVRLQTGTTGNTGIREENKKWGRWSRNFRGYTLDTELPEGRSRERSLNGLMGTRFLWQINDSHIIVI